MKKLSDSQFNELRRGLDFRTDPDAELCERQIEEARNDQYGLVVYYCYPNGHTMPRRWCYRANTNLVNNGMRISDLFDTQEGAVEAAKATGRKFRVDGDVASLS